MAGSNNAAVGHDDGASVCAVLCGSLVSHSKKQKEEQKNFTWQSAPLAAIAAKRKIIVDHRRSRGLLLSVESSSDYGFDDQVVSGAGGAPSPPQAQLPFRRKLQNDCREPLPL